MMFVKLNFVIFAKSKPKLILRSRDQSTTKQYEFAEFESDDNEMKLLATTRAVSINTIKPNVLSEFTV